MECTPNFWGRLSLTRTVKDIKKKPILQDRCQGPVILIKTSCPWGGGGGRICFGRNGENLFGGDGKNIWEKPGVKMIWGGGETFPPASQKNTQQGRGTCFCWQCWGIIYILQSYLKKALFCYPNLLISINANHMTIQNAQKQSC